MRNKLIAALAAFASSAGGAILIMEGLSLGQRVACVLLTQAGTVLAAFFKMPAKTDKTSVD